MIFDEAQPSWISSCRDWINLISDDLLSNKWFVLYPHPHPPADPKGRGDRPPSETNNYIAPFRKLWKCLFYGYFGQDPQKMIIFKNNFFHHKGLIHKLPTSPQWLSEDHFSPRYGQNRFSGAHTCPIPKYCYLGPDPPKMKITFFTRSALPIRFQKALNDYQMIIFHQVMTKNNPRKSKHSNICLPRLVYQK